MENVCPDGTNDQYVTSPSGEALGRNVNVRRSKCIINSPQQYNPGFGAVREWNNDAVASIVYMIQIGVIIAMWIRMISYRSCMSRTQKIVWIRHQSFI